MLYGTTATETPKATRRKAPVGVVDIHRDPRIKQAMHGVARLDTIDGCWYCCYCCARTILGSSVLFPRGAATVLTIRFLRSRELFRLPSPTVPYNKSESAAIQYCFRERDGLQRQDTRSPLRFLCRLVLILHTICIQEDKSEGMQYITSSQSC